MDRTEGQGRDEDFSLLRLKAAHLQGSEKKARVTHALMKRTMRESCSLI